MDASGSRAPMALSEHFMPANPLAGVRKILPRERWERVTAGSQRRVSRVAEGEGALWQSTPSRMGTGLFPAGQQQSWSGEKAVGSPPGQGADAGREGRGSGRQALLPRLFPRLSPLTAGLGGPGGVAGGRGRVAGACAGGQAQSRPSVCQDSSSTCSWLCTPVWPLTQIPAAAQGFMPLLNWGKAGERPLGLRGEAEPGRPHVPSVLLQQMSAQGGGGGHPGITSGDFLSC